MDEKHYDITMRGDHIYLKFEGHINNADLHKSTEEVVALSKREHVFKLLDDIRDLDLSSVTIGLQTEAIGLLWHLRKFKKIALLYENQEIGRLVATTLQTVHLADRCRTFEKEAEAIAWLQEA